MTNCGAPDEATSLLSDLLTVADPSYGSLPTYNPTPIGTGGGGTGSTTGTGGGDPGSTGGYGVAVAFRAVVDNNWNKQGPVPIRVVGATDGKIRWASVVTQADDWAPDPGRLVFGTLDSFGRYYVLGYLPLSRLTNWQEGNDPSDPNGPGGGDPSSGPGNLDTPGWDGDVPGDVHPRVDISTAGFVNLGGMLAANGGSRYRHGLIFGYLPRAAWPPVDIHAHTPAYLADGTLTTVHMVVRAKDGALEVSDLFAADTIEAVQAGDLGNPEAWRDVRRIDLAGIAYSANLGGPRVYEAVDPGVQIDGQETVRKLHVGLDAASRVIVQDPITVFGLANSSSPTVSPIDLSAVLQDRATYANAVQRSFRVVLYHGYTKAPNTPMEESDGLRETFSVLPLANYRMDRYNYQATVQNFTTIGINTPMVLPPESDPVSSPLSTVGRWHTFGEAELGPQGWTPTLSALAVNGTHRTEARYIKLADNVVHIEAALNFLNLPQPPDFLGSVAAFVAYMLTMSDDALAAFILAIGGYTEPNPLLATLPPGYRPLERRRFLVTLVDSLSGVLGLGPVSELGDPAINPIVGFVTISTNGEIRLDSASIARGWQAEKPGYRSSTRQGQKWLLDNISFPTVHTAAAELAAAPAVSATTATTVPPVSATTAAAFGSLGVETDSTVFQAQVDGFTAEQLQNAAAIIAEAHARGLDDYAAAIGVMTAITESSLRNIGYGDYETGGVTNPDGSPTTSVGLFQQQDSWGSREDRLNPRKAAGFFFARLVNVPGWRTINPWLAAQKVQISYSPTGANYEPHWREARAIVRVIGKASA